MKSLPMLLLVGAALALSPAARAQNVAAAYASSSNSSNGSEAIQPVSTSGTIVVHGLVKCPEGALPGAVVHVNDSRIYAVTDASGNFELTVPAATSAVEVTCSFAGFADTVQRLKTKAESTTIMLDKATTLPPRDRSAETSWW